MYADNPYGLHTPYEQYTDEGVDEYLRNASYENDQSGYEPSLPRRIATSTRQTQAAVGRARLSLPPSAPFHFEANVHQAYDYVPPISEEDTREYAEEPVGTMSHHFGSAGPFFPQPSDHQVFQQQASHSSPPNVQSSSPAYQASQRQHHLEPTMPNRSYTKVQQKRQNAPMGLPIVQGIQLVPVYTLPDRFHTIFPFAMFNAVQSACFESIYASNDNCVFSSPTGSGKTVLFEIAICRMLRGWQYGTFKVIYMAPTKSLCSERARDWKAKFEPLNLKCEEMTGDSDINSLHHVQRADIIVTTPEKWDSMTRKWKDHEKLVRLIKLLLIDEVHILNKDRGAALEVVVSRMKSIGSDTRFIALSATVPNSQDIATWLGRNGDTPDIPATHKRFGEEFRPVELKRHVCGYQSNANAFGFDAILTKKLPDIITKYSQKKPIMVFCFTRKACTEAAKLLAEWWKISTPRDRYWHAPSGQITVENKDLQGVYTASTSWRATLTPTGTVTAGVAAHHAGLSQQDRTAIERGYLAGDLSVICCTSTLAVGVNLPCHMVIIKNTVSYEAGAIKEYSDLEVMQMIGRAGRPQFDSSALAIILTKMQQVKHYEQLLSGQERLESCLHLNLVEHLNAEIGLGMIPDLQAARKWLAGTFLKVRLEDNPTHYQMHGDTPNRNLGARLEQICENAISKLRRLELIEHGPTLKSTEYGDAMARYYMSLATMESILSLPRKPKISEILTVVSQAHEFRELRFRSGEKPLYKELNGMNHIRFPIKIDLSTAAHKVSLIIQAVLGGVGHVADQVNHRVQYSIDQSLIFQHVHRLIRCIVDCQNIDKDAVGIRNSLVLSRSLAARVWDDSPMVLRQIEQIGPVAVRKLVDARITTMDELSDTDPGRLELVLNKASPFGMTMHRRVQTFPKLRVGLQLVGQPVTKSREHVAVKLKIDIGFLNEKTPVHYRNKPVFVIILLGTSDGKRIKFFRLSAAKLQNINPITETAYLTSPSQLIECYGMIDDLAGAMQQAVLKPDIPLSAFTFVKDTTAGDGRDKQTTRSTSATGTISTKLQASTNIDEWDDGELDDDDFIGAESKEDDFVDVDALDQPTSSLPKAGKSKNKTAVTNTIEVSNEQRLENGKFACAHRCKDRNACKHNCCKEGMEKKPKPRKPKDSESTTTASKSEISSSSSAKVQSKLELPIRRKVTGGPVEHLDLSQTSDPPKVKVPPAAARLASLHNSTARSSEIPILGASSVTRKSSGFIENLTRPRLDQCLNPVGSITERFCNDEPSMDSILEICDDDNKMLSDDEDYLDKDEDMLDAALVGLEDSQSLRDSDEIVKATQGAQSPDVLNYGADYQEVNDEPELFVTPHTRRVDDFAGAYEDVMLDESLDDDYSTTPGMVKRKRDDDLPSVYFPGKKVRTGDEGELETYEEQTQEDQGHEESEDSREKREKEELRAWLAAELGDSVEMVD
ncbi:P-loop containing nucleoside triphosphate hydrolase protein [Aureobasidium sp. EXF-10727]|nr:P-loop containing nucleoside triphosphate hydrolase protein [Aureobasidium sp. EXF-10727]